jgi:hypothetical protein
MQPASSVTVPVRRARLEQNRLVESGRDDLVQRFATNVGQAT